MASLGFVPITDEFDETSGESFSDILYLGAGVFFGADETIAWELVNTKGEVLSTGAGTPNGDRSEMSYIVPQAATADILGKHALYVFLRNTVDATINEKLAHYTLQYTAKKA